MQAFGVDGPSETWINDHRPSHPWIACIRAESWIVCKPHISHPEERAVSGIGARCAVRILNRSIEANTGKAKRGGAAERKANDPNAFFVDER